MESSGKFCLAGDKTEKDQNSQYFTVNMDFNKLNNEKGIENACKSKSKLVPSLTRTIKERFKNYSDEKEVYDTMQIIDPEHWMNDKEHGNDKLIFLAYRFSILVAHADFNKEKALIECTKFLIEIKTRFEKTPVHERYI